MKLGAAVGYRRIARAQGELPTPTNPNPLPSTSALCYAASGVSNRWSDLVYSGAAWLEHSLGRSLRGLVGTSLAWTLVANQALARCRWPRVSPPALRTAALLVTTLVLMGQLAPVVGVAPTVPETPTPWAATRSVEPLGIRAHREPLDGTTTGNGRAQARGIGRAVAPSPSPPAPPPLTSMKTVVYPGVLAVGKTLARQGGGPSSS